MLKATILLNKFEYVFDSEHQKNYILQDVQKQQFK